jgi:cytochrome P450
MGAIELPPITAGTTSLAELGAAREKNWVAHSQRGFEVLRWREGFEVLEHPHLLKAASFRNRLDMLGIVDGEIRRRWDQIVPCIEGEDRKRIRVSLAGLFRPMQVSKLQDVVRVTVNEVVNEVEDLGDVDVMHDIVWKIPTRLYCHLVSAPKELAPTVARISDSVLGPVFMTDVSRRQESIDAFLEAVELVREHLNARRKNLGDDFTSVMIRQHLNGALTEEELISESLSIMQASVDSTAHQMGIVVGELVGRAEIWKQLASDPGLIPSAVEEVIRYRPRWGTTYRLAADEIQIRDLLIPKNSWVFVSVRSGQRDPRVFDKPDDFRLERPAVRALMFGGGIYNCVGQHIARLEMQELLRVMVARFPNASLIDSWRCHDTNAATEVAHLKVRLL